MNDVTARSLSFRSRVVRQMPVSRSGSGSPTSAISLAPSATAIRLARIASHWIK